MQSLLRRLKAAESLLRKKYLSLSRRHSADSLLLSPGSKIRMAPSQTELKEIFNLYDDEMSGDIDGTQVGDVARACGLRVTNALVWKAAGKEYAKKGEKRVKFEEWLPIYEQLKKEEVAGTISDFMEGLKVFDQEGEGFITVGEFRHVLMAMGERLSKEEVDELMLLATVDGNGLMKYEPFIKLIVAGPGDGGDDK